MSEGVYRIEEQCSTCYHRDDSGWCGVQEKSKQPGEWCAEWHQAVAQRAVDPADLTELAKQGIGEVRPIAPSPDAALGLAPEEIVAFRTWRAWRARADDASERAERERFVEDDCKDPPPRTSDPQASHYAIPDLDLELYDIIRAGATPEELFGYLRWSIFERVWRARRKGGTAGAIADSRKVYVQALWMVQAAERLPADHPEQGARDAE